VSERPKPVLLYVLAALVLLEGASLAVGGIYLVVEIFIAPTASLGSAVALAACAFIAAAGLGFFALSTARGKPWIRGAIVCIAVLQLLVAYSILITKAPTLGWILLAPAILMLVLLFTRPVLRATARPPRDS
jgi:hypothetical protein